MITDTYNGMRIYVNDYAGTLEPRRKHIHRDDQSANYHKRIQKKWRKRFGEILVPRCYQTPQGLIMHPEIYKRFRHQINGGSQP